MRGEDETSAVQAVEPGQRPAMGPRTRAAIDRATEQTSLRPVRPEFRRAARAEAFDCESSHGDEAGFSYQLAEAFGTTSNSFIERALYDLSATTQLPGQAVHNQDVSAGLALVASIAPQNEIEAALAIQMAATHSVGMEMAQRVKTAKTLPAAQEYSTLMNKAMRTFTTQLDALGKMRRGGEQVVRHIHVHQGGQAVVADQVHIGGANNGRATEQAHGQSAGGAALLGENPGGYGVPIASDAGKKAMSPSRRVEHGGASRKSK